MKTNPMRLGAVALFITLFMADLGCGGGSGTTSGFGPNQFTGPTPGTGLTPSTGPTTSAAATISPQSDILGPRGTRTFTSTAAVTWTLLEGAAGGTITDDGAYTAPANIGTYHVVATSVADHSQTATATVQVVKSGFTAAGTMTKARFGQTATVLSNGKVLIAGGGRGQDFVDPLFSISEAELFDPSTGTSTIAGTTARTYATATLLTDGNVLMTGGEYGWTGVPTSGRVAETAEIYNSAAGQLQPVGKMGSAREYHAATLLADGRVLVTGGFSSSLSGSSAEIYDPASGTFAFTGSMTTRRDSHTTTLLTNGKVLVTGGNDYHTSAGTATAELYDPVTGIFTPTGSMGEGRQMHTATLLPDGNVLVTGGNNGGTADVYNPSSGTFTPAGHMNLPRSWHTATLLPDGTVLIAGGLTGNSGATNAAEIYDPATRSFVLTGSLAETRFGHTAVVLADGSVLFVGGATGGGLLFKPASNAEIFK